jgi:Holliday junction DNA helicase RuvA
MSIIAQLTGTLAKKHPTDVVIDVQGVGYAVSISLATYEQLPPEREPVTLLTHHHIREDHQQLFGFSTEGERDIFRLLISVSGIGPKTAQGILSGVPSKDITQMISDGNTSGLTTLPGIGRKTAERMILELREKIGRTEAGASSSRAPSSVTGIRADAVAAIVSLGFSRDRAETSVNAAFNDLRDSSPTLEILLKHALKVGSR